MFIFCLFLVVSNGLALFSFAGYSILSNTTSHLGAQGSPYSWVMNIVFICLGVMAISITYHSRIRYHQILGVVFGLSLVLTGFFKHAPLVDSVSVNQQHDLIHSIFASLTGFSFTLLTAGHGLISRGMQRTVGIIMVFVAIIISIAMMTFPSIMGMLQRVMFVSAFGWLFFYMKAPKNRQI
ncbi:DUF998 domain-containing protein [Alkalibaculum sporogenes]|uniref:DUF998 domain-containing protein n=1 Tax=Alkalibaculum sporogenes TaxID=2655001 RepID=UPI001A9ACEA8|nr:DUF998 domain-containing protein [Alkalibaculum sporogenes]